MNSDLARLRRVTEAALESRRTLLRMFIAEASPSRRPMWEAYLRDADQLSWSRTFVCESCGQLGLARTNGRTPRKCPACKVARLEG